MAADPDRIQSHGLRATEAVKLIKDDFRDGYLSAKRLNESLHTLQPLLSNPDPLLDENARDGSGISVLLGPELPIL